MGVLIDGTWQVEDPRTKEAGDGSFKRVNSTVRDWIAPEPMPPGRLHLFVAWNCPWAHRAMLLRVVKGLEPEIDISYAAPRRNDQGWVFEPDGEFADTLFGGEALHQVYGRIDPAYTGPATTPLLWDGGAGRAVSNESADILRMLNAAFRDHGPDLAPESLVDQIDAWNAEIHPKLNNGVYRAGFARTQEAYEAGYMDVFETLDRIEAHLGDHRYLCGETITEADLRLFPTLVRFDVAYHGAFKCNRNRLIDMPNLWRYARELYALPAVADTVRFQVYKNGYYSKSELRNPLGIVPLGPDVDWTSDV
ncbi:MAG: glutathione S-transferase C-terminal domain-containing protein [Pseudomonadota bacterium]